MLKIQEVRELIKLVDQSSIDEFVFEHEGSKIKMKKQTASVSNQTVVTKVVEEAGQTPVKQVEKGEIEQPLRAKEEPQENEDKPNDKVDNNLHKVTSPMVGTFYSSPSPDVGPYVSVGDKVNSDTVVCIVEAMKLFNEIESEVSGEIVEILVENGQLVEYGQPLFLVKPE